MKYKLIVALDFCNEEQALNLVDILNPSQCAVKVGSEMFTLFGQKFVQKLVTKGFKVFLDLKFHDIPITVARACQAAAELGVWMINVHASGGKTMLEAARDSLDKFSKSDRPLLIGVTVLTSMLDNDLAEIGVDLSLTEQVLKLAKLTKTSGLDGVVASALEVVKIKQLCGSDFITVTPGIRLNPEIDSVKSDQKRIVSPQQALALGSDYLVVGRPITQAQDPLLVIQKMFKDD